MIINSEMKEPYDKVMEVRNSSTRSNNCNHQLY